MRVLNATIEEADEDDLEDFLNDEKAIKLAESARQLLEHTFDDVLIHDTVVKELKDLSFVWKRFPQVLKSTIDEAKNTLANPHKLSMMELGKMTDVLKLAKHSPKLSYKTIQFVLQLVEEPDGWCHKEECIRRLCSIAEQMPQHAGELLPTLAKECVDESSDVRWKAMENVGRVGAEAPQHAAEVLPTLAKGCVDVESVVRQKALEVVGRIEPEKVIPFTISLFPAYKGGLLFVFVDNSFTMDVRAKFKTVPFFLHTSSSQKVGRWVKEVLDLYVIF